MTAAASDGSRFPIVGIGASAGGLEAVKRLLRALPAKSSMAFVLVQHLDPHHESMLAGILARETELRVLEVRQGMRVEPRNLYVIPPNATLELADGFLKLAGRRASPGKVPLPIDRFFLSLAQVRKSAAIGVVLSGNGSDGVLGLRAIKAEGGVTFAQDESAQFDGMPRAAIAAGAVDFVLPPEEIARELQRVAGHPFVYRRDPDEDGLDEDILQKVFGVLRTGTGVDFSNYRRTTVVRRLARRMAVNKIVDYSEYLALLRERPGEVGALYDDFLISVTSFFRDPGTFELLRKKILPALLRSTTVGEPLRFWVPGCATGEEAYSFAICALEAQDPSRPREVQIFATDVSEKAIEYARHGIYSESAMMNVSAERMRRFFTGAGEHRWQIARIVRDQCIFARQDVTADPPFSRLDLVSCRNLLIYLGGVLQRRLFPLFHHVLKPSGFLVLGSSESAAPFGDLFRPVDKRHRIFAKKVTAAVRAMDIVPRTTSVQREPSEERPRGDSKRASELPAEVDRLLIGRYAPPAVVINSNLEVVQFRGKTGIVLEPAVGSPSVNVLAMAREGLMPELRSAIHKARSRDARIRRDGLRVRVNGGFRTVSVEVAPLKSTSPSGRLYLVTFEVQPDAERSLRRKGAVGSAKKSAPRRNEVERLSDELNSTREYLQTVIEEQESANEELKSANEEVLSSNEELQSTNEELETAKEELQSANEELMTLNEELLTRNALLARTHDDLDNLLNSIQLPIVMLDTEGRIRRFTPAAEKMFNLIPSDEGRLLANLRPNVDLPDPSVLVRATAESGKPSERETQDHDGHWHLLRVHPYRTAGGGSAGLVLVAVDIDAQKTSALESEHAREYAEGIVDTVPHALLVLDENGIVGRANRTYYELFQSTPEETVGRSLFELGGGVWDMPGLRSRLGETQIGELEVEKEFEHIGYRMMLLHTRGARLGSEKLALLAIEDVTDRRRAERQLQVSEAQFRGVFESASEASLVLDAETGEILDANPYLLDFLEIPRRRFVGRKLWELPFVSGADNLKLHIAGGESGRPPGDIALRGRNGKTLLMEGMQKAVPGEGRRLVLTDVSQRRRLEQELRHVQKMHSIGRLAGGMAHDFNNILNIISAYAESLRHGVDPARAADAGAAIAKSVARGAGVVRQLLTFARKDEAQFRAVSVNDVVREAASMVGETFPRTVRVTTDLRETTPEVMADPDQLHQALLNLFVNARDAMPEGGELRLSTLLVQQEAMRARHPAATAPSYVCVEVADTGAGMDAETQKRIFEPFFTTKERGAGAGMGLAAVYGIVTSHRGFVEVDSRPGEGTRFRLYFPVLAKRTERDARRTRRLERPRGGSETILLVEDEAELLSSIAELLRQEGYTVLTARTGEESIEIYRARRDAISLLVTDVELPDVSGWDAFQKIRELDPDARALLVSGYLDSRMRARMLEGGAKGFLRKPYTLDGMLRAIREVLDEEEPDRAASEENGAKPGGDGSKARGDGGEKAPADEEPRSSTPAARNRGKASTGRPPRPDEGTEA